MAGATVTVRVANATPGTGALANIYAVDSTASPIGGSVVTSDATGTFNFYAPDGRYDLTAAVASFTKVVADVEISDIVEINTGDSVAGFTRIQLGATDTGISRTAAGTIALGNGTNGDTTGTLQARSYAGAWLMAETFTNVQAAINALPAAGGVVDARSPNVNLALGSIDPGTKQVTLLLGPYSYTCDHIVVEANFRIYGAASVNVSGAGTLITSVSLNTQPLIVNNTAGLLNIRAPEICDVTLIALSGNTSQDGMKFDLSANTTPSVIDHFKMKGVNFTGFKGNSIYIKGPNSNNGNFNQFFEFHHVTANRPVGSVGNSLRITGASGQLDFYSCQFDGNSKGNGTNIYIGTEANADTVLPYSINFYSLTSQASNIDFNGSGFNQVGFYNTHQENTNIVYQLDALHTNSRNGNVVFRNGYFANAGNNAGAGRILNITTALCYGVELSGSTITTVPDKLVTSTTGSEVVVRDNNFPQNLSTPNITTNIDFQTNPAATLNLGNFHTVMLQASATSITTLNSQLGPGELISFFANGTCQFATGGNITLPGRSSPLVLASGENATFENSDYTGTNTWRLVSVNSATNTLTPNKQIFNSSGTFTIPSNITAVKVTVVGGGGAGGGATVTVNGGGGGSGGCGIKWLSGLTPANTITVTVGSGGTGVSAATGNAGTDSSISSGTQTITTVTAKGGSGGSAAGAASQGGQGGVAGTNGDVNFGGNSGATTYSAVGGVGGPSVFGGAVNGGVGGAGAAGIAPGAGGSGAGAAGNAAGGAGAAGIIIFEWVN